MSKRRLGAQRYNEHIRKGKNALAILRHDIDELREANRENADVLNFLLKMSGRLDDIYDTLADLQEFGRQCKSIRLNGDRQNG